MFDFISAKEGLDETQRSKIFEQTSKGVETQFQFYLENATELSEEEIQEAIILFYKVQKGKDPQFAGKVKEYQNATAQ